MLPGVVVPVHLISSDMIDEEQMAKILTDVLTAAKSCKPSVDQLVLQYKQTSLQRERSHLKHLIRKEHQRALRGSCPRRMLLSCVDLMTHLALCDIHLDHAVVGRNIIVYCRVKTVEALSDLQRKTDSGQLSQLFSGIFTAFANTGLMSRLFGHIYRRFAGTAVTARVILSQEEYSRAFDSLTGNFF